MQATDPLLPGIRRENDHVDLIVWPSEVTNVASIGDSLARAFDEVWRRLANRVEGLTNHEYFWEPVPECWSVREDPDGRWRIDGERDDADVPEPPPSRQSPGAWYTST
jgi:hypothetical protein